MILMTLEGKEGEEEAAEKANASVCCCSLKPSHILTSSACAGSVIQLSLTLCDAMDYIAHQAPLSMGFSTQEYWSGLPFPSPEDLPDPGIEPRSPALQVDSLPLSQKA